MKTHDPVSNIRSIVYDPQNKTLEVRLYAGGIYRYRGVPDDIYRQLAETGAKEEYINRCIKPKFVCSKQLTV